jgi:cell shape-determining protein MreC
MNSSWLIFFFQHVVKLVALYDEQLEYLCSYPQKMTQLRAKVRSLEYEASRLKYLETEVEKLKSLLAEWDQELVESRRREALVEEKAAASD